jgi:molybdenum cofactor guanylyltransferase
MTGVVLCGGASTRMGTDKGLLKEEEITWAELAAQKLSSLNLPVFISINPRQLQTYEQIFLRNQLIVDNKAFDAKAPLFGLLSAHLQLPEEDLFVLACDLKDMTTSLMQKLYACAEQEMHEAYVYQAQNRPQPLCGIYRAVGLHKVYGLYQEGTLGRFSMMHTLEVLNTKYIPVNEEDEAAFNNYNSPDVL